MWVTEFEMVKFTKEAQQRKALPPMWVTEFEMVNLVNSLQ